MFRRSAAVVGGLLLVASTAGAVVSREPARIEADTLTALPGAHLTRPLRKQAQVHYRDGKGSAWTKLATRGTWAASWDAATGVPSRIWGSGLSAPGASANPAIAERIARQTLVDHIALLAPGSSPSDFDLVSNHSDGDIRSIGFIQHAGTGAERRVVVGGQVSFRFKRDRLFVMGSEALPDVQVATTPRLTAKAVRDRSLSMLRRELLLPDAPVSDAGDEVVLPLVADDGVLGYRIVRPVTIDGRGKGKYLGYVDASTGVVIAVRQQNEFTTGTVLYHSVDRYPAKQRVDRPAPRAHVGVAAVPQTTGGDGSVTWSTSGAVTVTTSVLGDLVAVANQATSKTSPSASLQIAPSSSAVWDASAVVEDDAQVQVYLSINIAKEFVRTQLDPAMATLDDTLVANANIDDTCNAFFDPGNGTTTPPTVNFFHATDKCQNTGLLQDVVFHEFGHDVHAHEVIPGVGAVDGGMGEGVADFFAANITGDHNLAPGFFYTDQPLRDLDPVDSEYRWPDDLGEVHKTGLIFGGLFWDLRTALITQYGEDAGIAKSRALFVAAIRRSVGIPSTLIEVLAANDDDGDLSNGTPDECLIRGVYARHGLHGATGSVVAPGSLTVDAPSVGVIVGLTNLVSRCHSDDISAVTLDWSPSPSGVPEAGQAAAASIDASKYYGQIPIAPHDSVLYKANVQFVDGSTLTFPDNRADTQYQLYQGLTIPLYCTRFDTDPFQEGWTTGTDTDAPSPWKWGALAGGASNPTEPFTGSHVLAQVLGGDYKAKSYSYVQMPAIDVGQYSDVRLQYRRWLTVEDSHFDQARITTNGTQAWVNFNSDKGDSSNTEHLDLEWRFHDVPLSGFFLGHQMTIAFDLRSDEGLQFGGWNLDDLCVVANPLSICGDGVQSATEECDDGASNADAPDACRSYCRKPICGDGIVDSNEECDAGPGGDPGCTAQCHPVALEVVGGCCSGTGGATGSAMLAGIVLCIGLRRRRRVAL